MERIITCVLISLLATFSTAGQSLDNLLVLTQKASQTNEAYLVFPVPEDTFQFNDVQLIDSTITDHKIALKTLQQRSLKKDIGLVFKANSQYNFSNDLDEETNNIITSRLKTELEWNILKKGFLNSKHKAQQIGTEIELLNLKKEQEEQILWRRQFRIDYTYAINKELITLFNRKEDFLTNYFDILSALHYQKRIKREHLIEIGQKISIAQKELLHTLQYNTLIKDSISENYNYPILPLLEIVDLNNANRHLNTITKDSLQIALHYQKTNWLDNISFSAYVNYNWLQSDILKRNFASIGLRLRVPLHFQESKKIIQTKIKLAKAIDATNKNVQHNQVITYFGSYREKIRDLHTQHKNWRLLVERKRVLQILKKELNSPETGLQILAAQADQFDILENILQLKKQLYTALSHLYELYGTLRTQPIAFKTPQQEPILITDETSGFSHEFEIAFLKAHHITSVYIVNTDSTLQEKWETAGFKVILISAKTTEKTLKDWIQEILQTIKT